jgi:resuscitation-promoting factor RpfB
VPILWRIGALLALSIVGIALLAPLAARSAVEVDTVVEERLLAAPIVRDASTPRGLLVTRQSSAAAVEVGGGAEVIRERRLPSPRAAPMEATIVTLARPAAAARVPTYSGSSVWDDLAQCESGGNWSINTGNGYYGGLQFSHGTWHGYGAGEFAEYPHQATREEQIVVAERLRADRGYQPWPSCRAKLGLP